MRKKTYIKKGGKNTTRDGLDSVYYIFRVIDFTATFFRIRVRSNKAITQLLCFNCVRRDDVGLTNETIKKSAQGVGGVIKY